MISDFRFACRGLAKSPGFAITSVAALALGVGANTAIFSLVNQLLLNPPGMSDPDRVVAVRAKYDKLNLKNIRSRPRTSPTCAPAAGLRAHAAMEEGDFNYTGGDMPERLQGASGIGGVVRGLRRAAAPGPHIPPGRGPAERGSGRSAVACHVEAPVRRRSQCGRLNGHRAEPEAIPHCRRDGTGISLAEAGGSVGAAGAPDGSPMPEQNRFNENPTSRRRGCGQARRSRRRTPLSRC